MGFPDRIERTLELRHSPERVWAALTTAEGLGTWFGNRAEVDLRVGGTNTVVMRGPDGNEFPSSGVYLEIVPNERLVFTDAFTSAWEPSAKPFMTVVLTFAPEAGGTRYTARVRHWSEADREAHEKMGFHQGWAQCTEQLAALLARG